jgi:hypothetical protein
MRNMANHTINKWGKYLRAKIKLAIEWLKPLPNTNPILFMLVVMSPILLLGIATSIYGMAREPYLYDDSALLNFVELKQFSSELPNDVNLRFDNTYSIASAKDITLQTKVFAVSCNFRSSQKTMLNSTLIGDLDFSPLYPLRVVFGGLGIFGILALWYHLLAKRKLVTMLDRIKKTKATLTKELVHIIEVMSLQLLPEGEMLISRVPPKYDGSVHGILGVREWRLVGDTNDNALLLSLVKETAWDSPIFLADKKPEAKNICGIYSRVLMGEKVGDTSYASIKVQRNIVTGLIENRGKVVEHADGILRSEYARMIFLAIHESNENVAKSISS